MPRSKLGQGSQEGVGAPDSTEACAALELFFALTSEAHGKLSLIGPMPSVRMVVVRGTSSLGMDRRTSPPERSNSTERARSKVIGATEPDPGLNF